MASLADLTRNDLRIMYRSALYLQSRLIRSGRTGPLLKLLDREIDLIKIELDHRREIEERRRRDEGEKPTTVPDYPYKDFGKTTKE